MSTLAGAPATRVRGPAGWHLRTRVIAVALLMLATICVTVGLVTLTAVNLFVTNQLDGRLHEASQRAVNFSAPPPGGGDHDAQDPLQARGQGAGTLNALVVGGAVNTSGVIDRSGNRQSLSAADRTTLAAVPSTAEPVERSLSIGDYRLVATRVTDGVVVTGLPLADRNDLLRDITGTFALVSLGGLGLTGVVGVVVIRRTLRPLEDVSAVATQVARLPLDAGEVRLAQRVPPRLADPHTEVGSVGHALNQMLDNVSSALDARQRSETRVRQFVADASHELRTPLAAIRGYTDLVRMTEDLSEDGARSLGRVESQSRRMTSLVEDLLLLARLDEGQQPAFDDVDLGELVVEVVTDAQVTARDHRWVIAVLEDPVPVRADPRQLTQVLTNLLSNARKHTDAGTTVTTTVSRSSDGRDAVLTVVDTGPGIDPAFLEQIFARFARADAARSGTDGTTGLGLAIVEAIVAAHGGRIEVASRPGRTEFAVRLPLVVRPRPALNA
ncbi:cell wall metabolism sensor histidine kinase WalK [Tersicoccus sp. Bi-70]|uniref:sensor histidine kinase n=1 Tax=Tersicoccus sp. Bi-70 TaxID=1897634 RepID=UPI000976B2A5|nr:HAMP domain-containing sensor histidine kinase [Tersicoccus sp. Bi-70]OMH30685.1 histidine kinase [Tersicoccus sp. Bi-70]